MTAGEVKKKGGDQREKKRAMASQTDCLAAARSQHSASYDFRGQRLSSLMNIEQSLVFLTKEKELFSLPASGKFIFRESVLPG